MTRVPERDPGPNKCDPAARRGGGWYDQYDVEGTSNCTAKFKWNSQHHIFLQRQFSWETTTTTIIDAEERLPASNSSVLFQILENAPGPEQIEEQKGSDEEENRISDSAG